MLISSTPSRGGRGSLGASVRERPSPASPGRLAAPRLSCGLATMLLSLWGFLVGTLVGWRAAGTMMGLSSNMYFLMFYRMIWFRDVVGLIVKGLLFGLLGAAICCYEGIARGRASGRRRPGRRTRRTGRSRG